MRSYINPFCYGGIIGSPGEDPKAMHPVFRNKGGKPYS
jgi:hypothetical protein